jgi:predicted nucleotidyltransferase component of viral defense system
MYGINWEESKALTPLKHDLLKALFRHTENFFLTGGSALSIFYFDHRISYDLDLFSVNDIDWHVLSNEIISIGRNIGADITFLSNSPTFRRYRVNRNKEQEIIDFVHEMVPQVYPQKNVFGDIIVDTPEEMAVNKWCTLLGRADIKDVIDLYFLSGKIDIWHAFDLAKKKEGAVDPSILSYLVSQIVIKELPDYLLVPLLKNDLQPFLDTIRNFLDKQSFPEHEDV